MHQHADPVTTSKIELQELPSSKSPSQPQQQEGTPLSLPETTNTSTQQQGSMDSSPLHDDADTSMLLPASSSSANPPTNNNNNNKNKNKNKNRRDNNNLYYYDSTSDRNQTSSSVVQHHPNQESDLVDNAEHARQQHQEEQIRENEEEMKDSAGFFDVCRNLSRRGLGIVLIVMVAFIWVSSSEFLQYVFGNEDFDKPFFVTYFNTMSFGLWMFGFACPVVSGFGANPCTAAAPPQRSPSSSSSTAAAVGNNNNNNDDDLDDDDDVTRNTTITRGTTTAISSARRQTITPNTPPHVKSEMHHSPSFENSAPPPPFPQPTSSVEEHHHEDDQEKNDINDDDDSNDEKREEAGPPYPVTKIAYAAFLFCPLWFFANVLFNYSLSRTSVASNTILSSTSTVWAMVFSRLLLKEAVTKRKLLALALSVGGAAMVGFGDDSSSSNSNSDNNEKATMEGNILAGVSAMFYAGYTTVLRHNLPDERRYPIGMCFAFVGVFNALLLWPGLLLLSYLGVEPFEWPSAKVAGFLVLNGLVGTNLSDVLWAKSVILTSPVIATLGLSLTIPVAMIADLVLRGVWHTPLYLGGAASVSLGFIVANLK